MDAINQPETADVNAFLRAGLDAAAGGLMLIDASGTVVYCNAAFMTLWDIPDNPTGTDGGQLLNNLNERLVDGAPRFHELNVPVESGLRVFELDDGRSVVGRSWPVSCSDDDPERHAGRMWQFHEVVERLRLTDERLRDFADVASDYYWETGIDGRFTFVSDRYQEISGHAREEVIGKTPGEVWGDFKDPDGPHDLPVGAMLAEHIENRETYTDIWLKRRRADGQPVVLSISGKPYYDRDGTFLGYRGIGTDVTEKAASHAAVQASEQRLRNLLDDSPVGISVTAADASGRLYANQAFADMISASSVEELIDLPATSGWTDMDERETVLDQLRDGGIIDNLVSRRKRVDGSAFWGLMNVRSLDFGGQPAYMWWLVDISERRESERLVHESEQRLQQILEESPIGISIASGMNDRRMFVNQAFISMMGAKSADQLTSLASRESWVDPEELAQAEAIIARGDQLVNFPGRRVRLDGSEFHALSSSIPIEYEGEAARVFWTADITEQKRAQETIRDNEQRLNAIFESSPIGFTVVSLAGSIRLFSNQAIADMFGFETPEEFQARDVLESWISADERAAVRGNFDRGEEYVNVTAQRRRKDGTEFTALMNSTRIEFQGVPARVVWITDISDRKEMEDALRESEQQLRQVIDESPIAISVSRISDGGRLALNKAFITMFGARSEEQLLAVPPSESWIDMADLERMRAYLEKQGELVDFESQRRRLDGEEFSVRINTQIIRFGDEPARVYWMADVTERNRAEQEIRENEQRLNEIIQSSPIGFAIIDDETGERIFVNKSMASMFGYASTDALLAAPTASRWIDEAARDEFHAAIARGEDVVNLAVRRRRVNGDEFVALMNSASTTFQGRPSRAVWMIDINDRVETENALRESEQRLSRVIEESPIPVSIVSKTDNRRLLANAAVAALFGTQSVDLVMEIPTDDTYADAAELDAMRRYLDGDRELRDFEITRRGLDGRIFPVLMNSHSIEFAGEAARVYWLNDISEQRHAEEIIRDSEAQMRSILESSPIGFSAMTPSGRERLYANDALAKIFGAESTAELLGQEVANSWVDVGDFEATREIINSGRGLVNFEAKRRKLDGTEMTLLLNSSDIDFEGERAHCVWMTDISARVEILDSLRQSEILSRTILESSPQGISVVSNDLGERIFVNQQMAEMFGDASTEEFVARSIDESWIDSAERQKVLEMAKNGQLINYEVRRRRIDGSEFWIVMNAINADFEGVPARVVWHYDITHLKEQRDALVAAMEQADSANRAKSDFLSSMSHELRTPMNAILGFGQLLQISATDTLSAKQAKSVNQIVRSGEHLLELIDQVLDLSKIEAGKLEVDIHPVSSDEILEECQHMIQPLADERHVSLSFEAPSTNLRRMVMADRTALRQIIINLLANAIKYNRPDGRVTVTRAVQDESRLRIVVTDTGWGIDESLWGEVFEPFSRLGAEASAIEGTGIGLTLSKRLAERMDGSIGFTSELDVGSTFWIDIPLSHEGGDEAASTGGEDEQIEVEMDDDASGLVLYVEDNPANVELMQLIFEHMDGLRLITAPSAEIGLEMAESKHPRLILMDIRLPGMDGYGALEHLKANPVTADIPVVAVSADAMPDNVKKGKGAGFMDYITKPLDVAQIMQTLGTIMVELGTETSEKD